MSLLNKSQLCNQSWHCLENSRIATESLSEFVLLAVSGLGTWQSEPYVRLTMYSWPWWCDNVWVWVVIVRSKVNIRILHLKKEKTRCCSISSELYSIKQTLLKVGKLTRDPGLLLPFFFLTFHLSDYIRRLKEEADWAWVADVHGIALTIGHHRSLANSMHNGNFCNHLIKFCTLMIAFALVKLAKINPNESN